MSREGPRFMLAPHGVAWGCFVMSREFLADCLPGTYQFDFGYGGMHTTLLCGELRADVGHKNMEILADMNDGAGVRFPEIADFIEAHL